MSTELNEMTDTPPRPPAAGHSKRNAVLRGVGLIAVVVAWLAIAGVGGPAIGSLSTVQSNDQESFLPAEAESVRAAAVAEKFDDSGALPAFVIFETAGVPASPEQLASWQAFTQSLSGEPVDPGKPELGTVGDYFTPGQGGQPPAVPLIPSQDGQAALVLVPLSADKVTTVDADGKDPLGDVISGIRTAAEAAASGAEVHIAGPAGLIADLGAAFAGID